MVVKKKKKVLKPKAKEYVYTTWRPTVMTEETVKKLLDAFSYSFTDTEACLYANISKPTLYDYIKKFPEFSNQKEDLKKQPNIKAKMNWISKIKDKDYQASKEWLERKSRDEFSTKQVTDNNVVIEEMLSSEQQDKINKLLELNN